MKNLKGFELIGAVVVFFVLLFLYTKLIGPIPFAVNNTNTINNTPFQANGSGEASAAPDTAVINLGITSTGATVEEAQNKTNEASQNIIDGLEEVGVEEKDIKTTNYSVRPNYSNLGESQNITGYTVTQNFQVEAPIDLANQVVDSATSNGANQVGGISFTLDDEKLEELRNEARDEAVEAAKRSAEGLASAAGISLGRIVNVQESLGGSPPTPYAANTLALDVSEESAPTVITPGETNVNVTVVLTYQTN